MSVAMVIPAYNEAGRIEAVLEVAKSVELIDEIIVVDDGSEDATADVAKRAGVRVVRLPINRGKGAAVQRGIESTSAEIIVFSDADILGMNESHIVRLIQPLFDDPSLMMTLGKFSGGRLRTDLSQTLLPSISGQRAMRRPLIDGLPDLSSSRFGVEIMIMRHAKAQDAKMIEVTLADLTHVMKEEKLGLVRGLSARIKMYQEMARSMVTTSEKREEAEDKPPAL